MKVKQVGKFSDEENQNQKYDNKKNNNTLLNIVLPAAIIAVLVIIYVFVINKKQTGESKEVYNIESNESKDNNVSPQDELKRKELELKEREFKLKEQELNSDETSIIKNKLNSWNNDLSNKHSDVSSYYADNVYYYSWGSTPRSKLIEDKIYFFKRWDLINLNLENINVNKDGEKYICRYDKSVKCENYSNGKSYTAKLASKLVFEKIAGDWKITEELDEKTYFLNKNW